MIPCCFDEVLYLEHTGDLLIEPPVTVKPDANNVGTQHLNISVAAEGAYCQG